jgi:hypothetical protein
VCPTGTNLFDATFLLQNGTVGFYSKYVGMPANPPGQCWAVTGENLGASYPAPRTVTPNVWHRVVLEVAPNSIGQSDGWQRIYLNGTKVAEWMGLRWRTSNNLRNNVVMLDPFVSGGSSGLTVWYDDISVEAIGTTSPPPPPGATLSRIDMTPASVTVATRGTQQFTVVGRRTDGSSQAVTPSYVATGGTVSAAGLYTAGTSAGSYRVIATASGFADTSLVTVTAAAPTLVRVELTPATVSLQAGAIQQFSAIGRRSDGSTQAVTPSWSATGGSISSGRYTAGSSAGTYRVIASASGFADTSTVTITTAAPPPPPPPSGGSFLPPDIEVVSFDAAGDNAKVSDLGAPFPGNWHTLASTGGRNGSAAMQVRISGGSLFEPIGIAFGSRTRVFLRYYVRAQGTPAGNVKGIRFHNSANGNVGGLWAEGPFWGFDQEGEAVQVSSGISWGGSCSGVPCTGANLADGQWHSIEMDYDRNAGSYVEARLWVDGRPVILPNGPSSWGGSAWASIQYVGGNASQGVPTTIRATRSGANTISDVSFFETISTASGSATVWIDDIAVSSQRIGP